MRVTVSVIKADIGAVGGHTVPSAETMTAVRALVFPERGKLLIDAFIGHTGDDIAIVMTHRRGTDNREVHQLAWQAFLTATDRAKAQGLYGAGQDLLKEAFSGNVRGLGPGSAEIEFDERPSEALMILLGDKNRYAIEAIWSRKYPTEQAAAVGTTRLRNIAGRYVGKDDPPSVVRTQKIFPATEEFGPPFALGAFVGGDTRGSHNLPLMPVPMNTMASTFFCVPLVSALGFSMHEGRLTGPVDLFSDPFWAEVRNRIADKAADMRRQGFFEPAMLPMSELEYGGIVSRLRTLDAQWTIRNGHREAVEETVKAAVMKGEDPDQRKLRDRG